MVDGVFFFTGPLACIWSMKWNRYVASEIGFFFSKNKSYLERSTL